MSTLTANPVTSHAAPPPAGGRAEPTFAGIVRGEWIKLLSLRSTWWALAATVAVTTLAALAAASSLDATADDPTAPGIQQLHGAEVIASGWRAQSVVATPLLMRGVAGVVQERID